LGDSPCSQALRRDAARDQLRLSHQAGAEAAFLHPVRRAAHIEVDLVVAEALANRRGLGEFGGIGAAELKRHGVLLGAEPEQLVQLAVQHGLRRHHLGVEQRACRQQTVEEPAMPVRPVHHGSHDKSAF
jgi:hypothetical protein